MWTLSGFVDEISEDFETQCSVAAGLGLAYVEIRSAWGVNILDLDDSQLATVQETLDRLRVEADEAVCVHIPPRLASVGQFYEDFSQISDEQVIEELSR